MTSEQLAAEVIDSWESRFARWASSTIAGSFLLTAVVILFIAGASSAATAIREHPVGALVVLLIIGAYVVSLRCLYKIRRRAEGSNEWLWFTSLLAICVPIIAMIAWLGLGAGLAISFLEVIAALIHVAALAKA